MEKDVKPIATNDQPAPLLTFHQFPELMNDVKREILNRFIPADLAQQETILALCQRIVALKLVSKESTEWFVRALEQPFVLECAVKAHIDDRLLCKDIVLRSISRALINSRLAIIARTITGHNYVKHVDQMLVKAMSELQKTMKRGRVTDGTTSKGLQKLLNPAIEEGCEEIALLAGAFWKEECYLDWVSVLSDAIKEINVRDEQRVIIQKLLIFIQDAQQREIITTCARRGISLLPQNDFDHALIFAYEPTCWDIAREPEEAISMLSQKENVSNAYKQAVTALRTADLPLVRQFITNNFNNHFRDLFISVALCYAIGTRNEVLAKTLLEIPVGPEMLILPLKIAISQGSTSLCSLILSCLEITSEDTKGEVRHLLSNYISKIGSSEEIIKMLCTKLKYPDNVPELIVSCLHEAPNFVETQLTESLPTLGTYSLQHIIEALIKKGHRGVIRKLSTSFYSLSDVIMRSLIRCAEDLRQYEIEGDLKYMYQASFSTR